MRLETRSLGSFYSWDESDISDLNWSNNGLRIVVEYWSRTDPTIRQHIEYCWPEVTRHRVLEESDLEHYWEGGNYEKGKFLFEVLSGGWLSNAKSENINIWCGREWFIYTSNMSATVIASSEPLVREFQ